MKRYFIGLAVLVATASPPIVASAQDTLTPYLESQRWDNVRRTQQAQTQRKDAAEEQEPAKTLPPITMAQRQKAWSRHKAEYRKHLLRSGQKSADAWLDSEIRAGR